MLLLEFNYTLNYFIVSAGNYGAYFNKPYMLFQSKLSFEILNVTPMNQQSLDHYIVLILKVPIVICLCQFLLLHTLTSHFRVGRSNQTQYSKTEVLFQTELFHKNAPFRIQLSKYMSS